MTRLVALVFALIAWATWASSQEVTVRSGEHDGYTRLVFNVPPNTGWVVKHRKGGARLIVDLDDVTYKTGGVFSRLTTNRLASLSQKQPGDGLELDFGCDCVASAFLYRDSMIVLDIAPGAILPPLLANIPPPQSIPKPDLSSRPNSTEVIELPSLPLGGQSFKDQLSTRLLQGADRDVLDLNLATIGPRRQPELQALPLTVGLNSNVELSTALDELNALLGSEFPQIEANPVCFTSVELGFETWADDRPFQDQVALLRAGLFQEFDRLNADRALALSKLYAYYGFGAESLQMLGLSGLQSDEAQRVAAIANIVDDQPFPHRSPFHGLQRCDSDAALWAALAERELTTDARVEAIEQSFVRLPDHLRRSLGPRLSSILVEAEQLEAARRVLRSVERVEPETTPSLANAKAEVAYAEGDGSSEESHLSEVIKAPEASTEAPLALARLVEKRWNDRGAVSLQELDLAATYAIEYRQTEMGPMMARTHVVALGLMQEFEQAFELIDTLPDSAEEPAVLDRHLQLLAERADDLTFLRQSLSLSQPQKDAVSTDTAIALSRRLTKLGFGTQAAALANRGQDRARRAERALLRAQAALQAGRPYQAVLELADDPSDAANALRIEAMIASRDFANAAALLQEVGDVQAANRYYWLANMPDRADVDSNGKFAELNATTQALADAPERIEDKPLANAVNLLDESAQARARIAALLEIVETE